MEIKICKYKRIKYKEKVFIEIRMTLLGFLLRNNWTFTKSDFESGYFDRWVPCYMNLGTLIKNKFNKQIK